MGNSPDIIHFQTWVSSWSWTWKDQIIKSLVQNGIKTCV